MATKNNKISLRWIVAMVLAITFAGQGKDPWEGKPQEPSGYAANSLPE